MPDLLAPLFSLAPLPVTEGLWVGRPLPHQSEKVLDFIGETFGSSWKAEASSAFGSVPPRIKVAVDQASGSMLGFCCWDCTALGFLGPIGVSEGARGRGVGKALVLSVLHSMREAGYAYAVIGGAGPVDFFRSICDARLIEGSDPGIYGNPIK